MLELLVLLIDLPLEFFGMAFGGFRNPAMLIVLGLIGYAWFSVTKKCINNKIGKIKWLLFTLANYALIGCAIIAFSRMTSEMELAKSVYVAYRSVIIAIALGISCLIDAARLREAAKPTYWAFVILGIKVLITAFEKITNNRTGICELINLALPCILLFLPSKTENDE